MTNEAYEKACGSLPNPPREARIHVDTVSAVRKVFEWLEQTSTAIAMKRKPRNPSYDLSTVREGKCSEAMLPNYLAYFLISQDNSKDSFQFSEGEKDKIIVDQTEYRPSKIYEKKKNGYVLVLAETKKNGETHVSLVLIPRESWEEVTFGISLTFSL